MFKKILIANRGEIACRIMRTARGMGVGTVAVYSDADRLAKHVGMADEAIHLGGVALGENYLDIEKVVAAGVKCGADAIHPGYGFLSENPEFVEAVERAGMVFIGPSANAIRAMGLKDAAKILMEKAGVPVVPGYHGKNQDADFLAKEAGEIGYPVLIKARAGGGGKGMRLVEKSENFFEALEGAMREGKASFGDGHVLIEKYISSPRHIEIQVFGDNHGAVVHMFERDCSLQRRHQKIIEEAPAPGMSDAMRNAMGQAAVKAAQAVSYSGAGTVEFIVDGSAGLNADKFWFMEMNTRLQVEHPVTEMITGLDLVELQLRVSCDEALPFAQDDLTINGWAFETRLYAEDPVRGFLPSTGKLTTYELPHDLARIDDGVEEGGEISPHYDPMIGKIIVHGDTRLGALKKMRVALGETYIAGIATNVSFLSALCNDAQFSAGEFDTGLIARQLEPLLACGAADDSVIATALVLATCYQQNLAALQLVENNWRQWGGGLSYIDLELAGEDISGWVSAKGDNEFVVQWGSVKSPVGLQVTGKLNEGQGQFLVRRDGSKKMMHGLVNEQEIILFTNGNSYVFKIADPLNASADEEANSDIIIAPMPGLIKAVKVKTGDQVSCGEVLVILEAMKMEHSLVSPREGEIEEITVSQGQQIEDGKLLVRLCGESAGA